MLLSRSCLSALLNSTCLAPPQASSAALLWSSVLNSLADGVPLLQVPYNTIVLSNLVLSLAAQTCLHVLL